VLLTTASTIVLNRSLFKTIPYDPVNDFSPIAPLAVGRLALVTNPPSREKRSRIHRLRERPTQEAQLRISGNGTPHHWRWKCSSRRPASTSCTFPTRVLPAPSRTVGRPDQCDVPPGARRPAPGRGRQAQHAGGRRRAAERAPPNVPSLAEAAGVREVDTISGTGFTRRQERRATSLESSTAR
jgi:hypothetical protein